MRRLFSHFLLIICLALSACSSIRVSQDYDPAADFTDLRTYRWQSEKQAKTGDLRADNPLLDGRVRAAIDNKLKEKGYQRVSGPGVDFHVAYRYAIKEKPGTQRVRTSIGIGSFGRHGGFGVSTGRAVSEYDQAVLVIDVIDGPGGNFLWRGMGIGRPFPISDPERIVNSVNDTVAKILKQFPPD